LITLLKGSKRFPTYGGITATVFTFWEFSQIQPKNLYLCYSSKSEQIMQAPKIYKPKNHVRIVTAASLFDGHDAAINVMRRIIQSSGAEVIHLGHNRSVYEIVNAAIQEDAQAIAMTSYQGGHMEFLTYMYDMLNENGCGHIKIFAGGGGVILPDEIEELLKHGITRIYSPDDGMKMGLQGMINDLMEKSDFPTGKDIQVKVDDILAKDYVAISRLISEAENYREDITPLLDELAEIAKTKHSPVLGITGTGGAGKSSLVDEIVRRFTNEFPDKTMAIISVDPSKRKSGGALLGDRIRMNAIDTPQVFMRSLATRQSNLSISKYVKDAEIIAHAAGFDLIILETSGIGQSDTARPEKFSMPFLLRKLKWNATKALPYAVVPEVARCLKRLKKGIKKYLLKGQKKLYVPVATSLQLHARFVWL